MKHLKTYENLETEEIKKYVINSSVTTHNRELLTILQIFGIVGGRLSFLQLYHADNNVIKSDYDFSHFLPKHISETSTKILNVLYTSNNLQHCVDKLQLIIAANKYNL